MKIVMEATPTLVELDGVGCRVWNGKTEKGIDVTVFVHRIAVHKDEDQSAFEAELEAAPLPARTFYVKETGK